MTAATKAGEGKQTIVADLVAALDASRQLVDDLMAVYVAPEECSSYVTAAKERLAYNGTLGAIADTQAATRSALARAKQLDLDRAEIRWIHGVGESAGRKQYLTIPLRPTTENSNG